jgi:hypothetical protein
MVVEQADREAALEAGDFTVVDWSRPGRWATASERAVSLMFPRALLALPHEQVARLGGVRISGRRGAWRALLLVRPPGRRPPGRLRRVRRRPVGHDHRRPAHRRAGRLDAEDEVPAGSRQEALRRRAHAFIEQRLSIHLVPVLFGSGTRMFEHLGNGHVQLENLWSVQTAAASHLRFRVIR